MTADEVAKNIVDAAMKLHRVPGSGLLSEPSRGTQRWARIDEPGGTFVAPFLGVLGVSFFS
jgi:hypothetical protein